MKKLTNFYQMGFENGMYGCGTQSDITEICQEYDTTVYNQELANYSDAEWFVCCGECSIKDGYYNVVGGLLEVIDGELEFIDLKLCV